MNFSTLEEAKGAVKELYETGAEIRMNITLLRPRLELRGVSAVIKGAYPHMFRVEIALEGCTKIYSVQYTELLTGKAEILNQAI